MVRRPPCCTSHLSKNRSPGQLQALLTRRMGAEVIPVTTGSRTLKDAVNETFRDWVASVEATHYISGTAAGPHPSPPN